MEDGSAGVVLSKEGRLLCMRKSQRGFILPSRKGLRETARDALKSHDDRLGSMAWHKVYLQLP